MGAVWMVLGAEFRRRWRSWLILVALIAVIGGLVLAGVAAGRRTASAFPRFVAVHGFDVAAYNPQSRRALLGLPEVAAATTFESPLTGRPGCACGFHLAANEFGVVEMSTGAMHQALKLVAGRWPDPSNPSEALATFPLAQDLGVHVGTVIRVPFFAPSQAEVVDAGGELPMPRGPTVSLRVVGVEAAEVDFPSGSAPSYGLYSTNALRVRLAPVTAGNTIYLVRLKDGAADLPRFNADVQQQVAGTTNLDASAANVQSSIHPQAVGWWVLAVLVGLAGIVVVGQALGRQSLVESEEYSTLMAIGMSPRRLVALVTVRNLALALAGAIGAVGLAFALSPVTPLGEARIAEPITGFAFDAFVLIVGASAVVVAVLLVGSWPAVRASRMHASDARSSSARHSTIVTQLSALGAPPAVVIGTRHAFDRGRGAASVPVGSAFLGTALAVTALCATAVFGSSLTHLVSTPSLYGDAFQVIFSPNSDQPLPPSLVSDLKADPAIAAVTEGVGSEVTIHNQSVAAVAMTPIRGPLLLSIASGAGAIRSGEVGLGATTMQKAGAHVGSVVPITFELPSGGARTVSFRVVSQISFPADFGNGGLGTGAAFSINGYVRALCPPGPASTSCVDAVEQNLPINVLAKGVPGPKGQAAIAGYAHTHGSVTQFPLIPTSLVNFGQAVNFPLILGVLLGLFGTATLLHLLVVSVTRRRREIGLLKAIGFIKGQIGVAVCWQASSVALVGIVIGIPLGIVIGRAVWRAFAANIGAVAVPTVPIWLMATLAAGVLVAANVLATVPAVAASRSGTTAELLRTQ